MSDKTKPTLPEDIFGPLVETTEALVFICDQNKQIVYANPAACKRLNINLDALIGREIRFVFPTADFDNLDQKLAEIGNWQGELEYNTTDSDSFWYRASISARQDKSFWMLLDISEQKEKERKQALIEKKLQSILDNIPAYVYSKNQKGEYTYVNNMLASLHALNHDEVIGKTDFDLFTNEAAKVFSKNDKIVFERHKTVRALEDGGVDEYGIERCYLSVKCPLENEDGIVEELLGMAVDISEQQRLEKALWESQEKLNSILDNMKARVYIKDTDLKYTYANEELCQTLQMDRTSLTGKTDFDLFDTKTAIGFRTTDQEVFDTRQKVSRLETSINPRTKEKQHFWSVKVPLMSAEGVPHALLGISTDMTEQKRLEKKLIANERKLTTILDNIKAHVYIKDINSVYTYVNANMCEYLGKAEEEVVGHTDSEIFGDKAAERFRLSDKQVYNYRETCTSIEKSRHYRTGESCYFLSVKAPLINDLGNPYALIGISTDVSEQQRMEKELRMLASTDVLTGANNRRHFLELCEREIERSKRYKNTLSLIMLDVDHFKSINDTHGHAVGDDAIRAMTTLCRNSLRNTDVLGRIGGEEFAILLPETDITGAWQIAQRIRKSAEDFSFKINEKEACEFTASFGVTSLLKSDQNPDDLLKRADIALYEAKTLGRNRVCEKIE